MILQSRGANWLLQMSPNKPWSLLSFFVISSSCCQQVKVENKDQCSRLKKIMKQSKFTVTFKNSYLIIFEIFNFTITLLYSLTLSPHQTALKLGMVDGRYVHCFTLNANIQQAQKLTFMSTSKLLLVTKIVTSKLCEFCKSLKHFFFLWTFQKYNNDKL